MKENKIESFSALETALSNLQTLSEDITKTFQESNSIYESQGSAWASANSSKESNKMTDYAGEAAKIATNVSTVSEAINKFKTATRNVDEQ